ncbi:MAG TPA: hypothetical protein VII52_11530 [Gemmatimonadaceae bacterium]
MKRIELKFAVKAAERDIAIGWATVAALSLASVPVVDRSHVR